MLTLSTTNGRQQFVKSIDIRKCAPIRSGGAPGTRADPRRRLAHDRRQNDAKRRAGRGSWSGRPGGGSSGGQRHGARVTFAHFRRRLARSVPPPGSTRAKLRTRLFLLIAGTAIPLLALAAVLAYLLLDTSARRFARAHSRAIARSSPRSTPRSAATCGVRRARRAHVAGRPARGTCRQARARAGVGQCRPWPHRAGTHQPSRQRRQVLAAPRGDRGARRARGQRRRAAGVGLGRGHHARPAGRHLRSLRPGTAGLRARAAASASGPRW